MTALTMDSGTTSSTVVSSSPPTPAPTVVHQPASPPVPPLSPSSPKSLRRDDEFYCQDVVFLVRESSHVSHHPGAPTSAPPIQVEDVLFKVPRRPFEYDSEVFSVMFTLPPVSGAYGVEGVSDDNPIRLEGVNEDEFRPLLWVMFRS